MIPTAHTWLIDHPIWQNVIINVAVGLSLILLAAYWKVIVAFSRIPPQRLGTWLQKARLNAAENRLYQLRRANEDSRYALYCIALLAWRILPFLAVMMVGIFALVVALFVPWSHKESHPTFHRIILTLWSSIPAVMIILSSMKVRRFCHDYANFEESQDYQLERINKIRAKLGLNPKTVQVGVKQQIELLRDEPIFSQGMRVESPKFGEGTVMNSEMKDGYEKVTVLFNLYGVKKLVAHFANLKVL